MLYDRLKRIKHKRDDGWLSEVISMNYDDEPFNCIHSYIVSIEPNRTRANHYHKKKEEWVALAAGKIKLSLKDIITGRFEEITMDSQSYTYEVIHIPPFVAHAVTNVSEREASLIVFSKNPEDKEDTIPYEVVS
nr:WxcM-like domain-containing protein [uncultured Methanolobus sp.]